MTLERLRDVTDGVVPNSIMPLFWQKGGPTEVVREEMERIGDAGIGAVILEARPHPEFLGDGWWRDVDAVLEIARRRDMKVWFFDDDTFPTGHAGGAVETAAPDVQRRIPHRAAHGCGRTRPWRVAHRRSPKVLGARGGLGPWSPPSRAGVSAGGVLRRADRRPGRPHRPHRRRRPVLGHPGWLVARLLPLGHAATAAANRHAHHIDYLNADSTQLLIDSVYERIHERYADEFGSTIAGFFSDEPGLYNDPDTFDFGSTARQARAPALERRRRDAALSERLGTDAASLLPQLWWPAGGREREVRYAFMDVVTSPVLRQLQPATR